MTRETSSKITPWKILRFVILGALIVVIVLLLKKPAPPAPELPQAEIKPKAEAFEQKLAQIETARQSGETAATASFTTDEVNAFITDATAKATEQLQKSGDTAAIEAQAEVKNTRVAFEGDEVIAQAATVRYGQDVYVTVRGHLSNNNGYLEFTPTGFKIGEMTIPVSMVAPKLQEKLSEPANHEKLKLPEFVKDLRIENGQLLMTTK